MRCNAICPGYVHTPLVDGHIRDTANARCISRDPVGPADQIAAMASFPCSPEGASINGAMLQMDSDRVAQ